MPSALPRARLGEATCFEVADAPVLNNLDFGSRPALLLALVDFVDESEGLSELSAQVRAAPTGVEALDRLVQMNAT